MGCPRLANNDRPYAGINAGPSLFLLPSSDKFYDSGLAFRQEEEDKDNDGDNSQKRNEGKGTMTTTMTTVAMGGATLNDNETGTLLQVVATAMALPNVSLAPHCCTTRGRPGSVEIYSVE